MVDVMLMQALMKAVPDSRTEGSRLKLTVVRRIGAGHRALAILGGLPDLPAAATLAMLESTSRALRPYRRINF